MRRKLIRQGGSGLTLYVPKKWVDSRNLKPGDEVDVAESGDFLVLSAGGAVEKQIVLKFKDEPLEHVVRSIIRSYCAGHGKIVVEASESIVSKAEVEALQHVIGFEVVRRQKGLIVLENISEPSGEKFDALLRRMFLLVKDMSRQVGSIDVSQPLQADKLGYFCLRTLSKNMTSFKKPMLLWELLHYLSAICYGYYYLSKKVMKHGKIAPQTKDYLNRVNEFFEKLYLAYYEKDLSALAGLYAQRKNLVAAIPDKLLESGIDPVIVWRIQHIAYLIRLCANTVFYAIL